MKKYKFSINGNPYEVEIEDPEGTTLEVTVNGTTYEVELDKAITVSKTPKLVRHAAIPSTDSGPHDVKTSSPAAPKGSGNIKSPLPGTILDIHVVKGDQVRFGQKLITLEAMKMENVINSDKEGTVSQILVSKGGSVMEGDTLITIT
ncbi:MAG TPA: biotin/lipoyl-binding protein [Bacteroidales bacterium]|nr:biotin/lipoyl-binding protein [Bacteroidales bacterium]HSA44622.1 biotin/lipoyl-binding protein [Bacteroidales bacterium]